MKIDQVGAKEARTEIAMIKYHGAAVLHDVIDKAIQVHGTLGFSTDLPLEEMYRWARAARIYDGPDEVHRVTVARRCELPAAYAGQLDAAARLAEDVVDTLAAIHPPRLASRRSRQLWTTGAVPGAPLPSYQHSLTGLYALRACCRSGGSEDVEPGPGTASGVRVPR